MNILYVITGLGQGGAERVVCDLADQMFKRGHKVKIAYLVGDIITQPKYKEIELIHIGLTNILSLPTAYLKLAKIIKSYHPDVVHAHMVHANLLSRLVRVVTPMSKLINTAHSSNEGGVTRMLAYRVTHSLADLTTNVSDTAVAAFEAKRAVPKDGMKTVYNGININKFSYSSSAKVALINELDIPLDTKIILAVGRFNESKNYFNLLRAIRSLKSQYSSSFLLLIAGDGELRDEVEQFIIKLDLEQDVILLGRRSDIPLLMSACDLYVLSSDYEGLPTVLIEALACQANVVSTNVSGAHEIIKSFGKIVPVDHPKALVEAIEHSLMSDNKNILGYEYVKTKFDLNIISDEWLNIYNEN